MLDAFKGSLPGFSVFVIYLKTLGVRVHLCLGEARYKMGSIGRHHRPQVGGHVLDEEARCCRTPGHSFENDAKNHRNAWSNHDLLCNPNQLLLQSNANSCHMSTWCKCPFHIPKRLQHHVCNIKSITNPCGELPPRKERKRITYIFWKVTSYPNHIPWKLLFKGSFPSKELGSSDHWVPSRDSSHLVKAVRFKSMMPCRVQPWWPLCLPQGLETSGNPGGIPDWGENTIIVNIPNGTFLKAKETKQHQWRPRCLHSQHYGFTALRVRQSWRTKLEKTNNKSGHNHLRIQSGLVAW